MYNNLYFFSFLRINLSIKNRFIKSTIILIIGGFFTKLLGLIIKIVLTRLIGTKGIGMYSLLIATGINIIFGILYDYLNIKKHILLIYKYMFDIMLLDTFENIRCFPFYLFL